MCNTIKKKNETLHNDLIENNKALYNSAWKIEDLEEKIKTLSLTSYNEIEMPTHTIEQLKKDVNMLDSSTIKWMIKYLTLDSYEFVKNNAKSVNKESGYEAIMFRDGGLSRNEGLIKALKSKVIPKDNPMNSMFKKK